VFAKLTDGTVVFYKDGYTDLRGKFNYLSLSTDAEKFIDTFSILVMSPESGTTIIEAFPPEKSTGIQRMEGQLQKQLRRDKQRAMKKLK